MKKAFFIFISLVNFLSSNSQIASRLSSSNMGIVTNNTGTYMWADPTGGINNMRRSNLSDINLWIPFGDTLNYLPTKNWVNTRGFMTSFTETDPTVPSYVKSISTGDLVAWNSVFMKLNTSDTASLSNRINSKFNIPTGTTLQYLRGDGTAVAFPSIPAAQVSSDWSATSGVSQILNKPTTLAGYQISDAYPLTGNPSGFLTTVPAQSWASITGKPNTLAGYSIIDGVSSSLLATTLSGYVTASTYATGLAGKQNAFTGSTSQYVRGDGSLASFPSQNVYNAGFGISKSGTEPSASFAINTADIMTVNRAADSIASINNKVNGKVAATTTITINGDTKDLSTNRSWSNIGIELPTQTGQNGKYLTTNGTTVSWNTVPTAPGATNASAYSAGTPYALTATMQKVDFGTTDPVITLPSPGTYLICTNVKLAYNGLLSATNKTVTLKLRRTNNTATDLTNSTTTFVTQIVSLLGLTGTAGDCDIPDVIYTTANSNDTIEMWGNINNLLGLTGSMDVQEASIVAIRLY